MPPRLSSARVLSFLNFYTCSTTLPGTNTRALSTCLNATRQRTCSRRIPRLPSSLNRLAKQRSFHASGSCSAPKDPYSVLGVNKDASPAEIKKIYFSLARKYHPDTNPDKNAQEKFVEIQEAYDILKDEKKRAAYDQYGAASQQPGFDPNAFAGGGGSPFGDGFAHFHDFASAFGGARGSRNNSDMFEQLFGAFGGGRGGARASAFAEDMQGSDLEAAVGVTFMEACKGTTRSINITPIVDCSTCHGTGLKAGAKRSTCTSCGGTGATTFVLNNGFHMASTCTTCKGTGTTVPRGGQCGECAGVGRVRVKKSVKIDIPAGVEDGMVIRIPNAGDAPVSGKGRAGDLLVRVNVATSQHFRRQGSNLHHEARIPLHSALLGGRVRIPTLDGEVDVRVPAGTQHGEEMVLKSRGLPSVFGGGKGDLFVTFTVQLPRSLTKRQREILQQYADDVEGRAPSSLETSPSSVSSETPNNRNSNAPASDENESTVDPKEDVSSPQDDEDRDRRKKAAAA